jgi:multiple sugar transport system substrate-binding protein
LKNIGKELTMKKIVSLSLVLALVVVFNAAAGGGGQDQKSSGPVTLDFPTWQAEEGGFAVFWKEMKAQFESKNSSVAIQISNLPFAQYTDTLITRFSAGDPPDIVHIPTRTFSQYAAQGWFSSLDADFAKTDILQNWTALQKSVVYKGQNQGLLLMGYGAVMFYNEKILNEAGVKVPVNREELIAAVKAIAALNKDYNAFGLTTQQHNNVYSDFANFVTGYGSSLVKDGKYNFNDPKLFQAAEDYRFISSYAPKGISSEMMRQMYIDGKIAMFVDGPFVAALIDTADPALKPFLKLAKPPFEVEPGSISNSLHVASDLKGVKRELVIEFIKQVAEPANQVRYSELTRSPAGRSTIAGDIKDPALQFANDMAKIAVNANPDSEKLMVEYTKFVNTLVNSVLKLQMADASVTTRTLV